VPGGLVRAPLVGRGNDRPVVVGAGRRAPCWVLREQPWGCFFSAVLGASTRVWVSDVCVGVSGVVARHGLGADRPWVRGAGVSWWGCGLVVG
jgi:hypothetical protein